MNTSHALTRADAALKLLRALSPPADVVMLQEMTALPRSEADPMSSVLVRFRDGLSATHELHTKESWAAGNPYFVVMLVRRGLFAEGSDCGVTVRCEEFVGSRMARGFVSVSGLVVSTTEQKGRRPREAKVCFVTSHLESEKAGAEQRKTQLGKVVELMRENARKGMATIFSGDTNLREPEISGGLIAKTGIAESKEREGSAAGRPLEKRKIGDAFVQAGAPAEDRYTWDMSVNDNLDMSGMDFRPRSRYDRAFVFGPSDAFPVCTGWKLLGKERLECEVFVSDHWGVLADFRIPGMTDREQDVVEEVEVVKRVAGGKKGKAQEEEKVENKDKGRKRVSGAASRKGSKSGAKRRKSSERV